MKLIQHLTSLLEATLRNVVDIDTIFSDLETNVFFTLFVDYPEVVFDAPGFKEKSIKIEELIPIQTEIDGVNVNNDDPLTVVSRSGKYYIIDGHHRFAKYLKQKKKLVDCLVLDFPSHTVDLHWFEEQLNVRLNMDKRGIVTPNYLPKHPNKV